jgi:hypothetical protein
VIPSLKKWPKYFILLLLITCVLNISGYIVISIAKTDLKFSDILILSLIFALITLISIRIFLRGQIKEPDNQVLFTLVSISLRFLLDLITAFVWFFVTKKTGLTSVLLFFILYLSFTLFSIQIIFNALKNKLL